MADTLLVTVGSRQLQADVVTLAQTAGATQFVSQYPSSDALSALTPATATAATSLLVKGSAGNFYGGSITAGATAGFLIAYNANAAPAASAALTAANILGVVAVAANGSVALGEYAIPDRFSAGVVLLFSTSTTNYTVPANPALFMRGRAA